METITKTAQTILKENKVEIDPTDHRNYEAIALALGLTTVEEWPELPHWPPESIMEAPNGWGA